MCFFARGILSNLLLGSMPRVVIAHSMGGIVVRDAINLRRSDPRPPPLLYLSLPGTLRRRRRGEEGRRKRSLCHSLMAEFGR